MKTKLLLLLVLFTGTMVFGQTLEAKYEFATNGDLTDASGNGRTLTKVGSTLKTFATDNFGNVESAFDAQDVTGEYLVATGYKGVGGDGARTVAAWIKLRAGANRRTIASWGINESGQMFNVMVELGKIRIEAGSSSILSSHVIPNGSWHHVAVTFDPTDDGGKLSSCKMYIDGVLQDIGGSFNASTTIINTNVATHDVRIGEAVYGTTHFYRGVLNDVAIYSGALSQAQVAALAEADLSGTPSVDFMADVTSANIGEDITFDSSATTNNPTVWVWDFGGGDASGNTYDQNPVVSYGTPGTYTITLIARNASGEGVLTKTNYITITGNVNYLKAQYNFDGDLTDNSGETGTLVETGFSAMYENDNESNPNAAITLPSVDGHSLASSGNFIVTGNSPRTVTAWIKTNFNEYQGIVSMGASGTREKYSVVIDDSGRLRTEVSGAGHNGAVDIADDTWHHIASVYDGSGKNELYVDGSIIATSTGFGTLITAEAPLYVGTENFDVAARSFKGALDDVRVYSRALTSSEITSVYNRQSLSVASNLEIQDISLFPTKVSEYLTVRTKTHMTLKVSVYNMLGGLVSKIPHTASNEVKVDMSTLATGLYIVKVRSGLQFSTFKVIKQ
ncbi:LamG-like jellyroll fold domain-containing protein [Aestuariivivens sp. NBU2969]|uniref:LamG-like jellyroll fold domain-containing protein n=1 Tax=Aestuariivivens sp. NBU2969 TaxID=2873267 RepID=UPI001CBAD039|nr:LamG-like jellyroll fold domain-containing protein [Aestuariivivens sp. NBU2969]